MQYSLPAIVATAASSLYNVIDRIFIGHGVGPMAISGLALTLPLMNFAAAFGALVGAGASTMISIRLGEKDRKSATQILGNAIKLNLILGVLVSIFLLVFLDPILMILGASHETLPYAREFMQVILAGNVFTHIYIGLNNIMRASGFPKKAMMMTLMTVGVNLILAPTFIFGLKLGIRGAAMATIIAQIIGAICVVRHYFLKTSRVRFLPGYFKLQKKIILDIVSIGGSNFLMLTCASLIVILLNIGLGKYGGDYAIGAFGIINSLSMLFAMIVIGFNQGMQPIAGYNYGAKKYSRVLKVFKGTVVAGSIVMIFGFILGEFFSRPVVMAFTNNNELIDIASKGMRIVFITFPIVGFQMVTANFFQAIGKAKISIFLAMSRQVLLLIPALLILPHYFGLFGVWAAMPFADFISSLVSLSMLMYQMKRLVPQEQIA